MKTQNIPLTLAMTAVLGLVGCGDSDEGISDPANMDQSMIYNVSVVNLAYNQPLAPIFVALHDHEYVAWTEGLAASSALEMMAESGDVASLNSDANNSANVQASAVGNGIVGPSGEDAVMLTVDGDNMPSHITVASMLVNTNDAFVGVQSYALGELSVGDSVVIPGYVWDAGTELNTEAAGTIPGPADSGEGYNAERESADRVRIHAGVISADDGLVDSVLDSSHRFLGPVAHVVVTRAQ